MSRIDQDSYFMKMAFLIAERSTCLRRKVGAVLVKDGILIATGYNGAPKGYSHCSENRFGCIREEMKIPSGERHELCRAVHAEQNLIIQASLHHSSSKDGIVYCTHFPCSICAKILINSGIREIYYFNSYDDYLSWELLQDSEIELWLHNSIGEKDE